MSNYQIAGLSIAVFFCAIALALLGYIIYHWRPEKIPKHSRKPEDRAYWARQPLAIESAASRRDRAGYH